MKAMHLSEAEARNIVQGYANAIDGKAHDCKTLWDLIKEVKANFPYLTWREDKKCFYKGL